MSRPTIVCLCGSTRFSEAFREANLRETLAGNIVLSIGVDTKSDADLILAGELTEADKERLDQLHLRKIDMADEILVLNVDGYIGNSTSNEVLYALKCRKRIRWLEPDKVPAWFSEDIHMRVDTVRGAIIGALAGGHLDGRDGPSYARNVLFQIASFLDLEIPEYLYLPGEKR